MAFTRSVAFLLDVVRFFRNAPSTDSMTALA